MSALVRTTCPYCGVGCGVLASRTNDRVEIIGDPEHPANFGRLCSKGATLGDTVGLEERLLYPEIHGKRVGWDEAVSCVAQGFTRAMRQHGPDAVAFYVSGQLLTEDYYVANKLMKGFIGTANIDTNSRLCMASAVAGHKRAFGEDLVPVCYEDLDRADLIVLVGSNTAWCHPVLFQRIARAKERRPDVRIVVIDPRRTATCELADLHLPIRSGTDVWLFNGLLAFLHRDRCADTAFVKAHTVHANRTLAIAERTAGDVSAVAQACGVDATRISEFYRLFAQTERVVTAFSQGVNQSSSGTDKVNSIVNCHLLCGRIGRPGMGPFSVTGQPNAMGGREVGGMANTLAAHMEIDNTEHRRVVQEFWRSPRIAEKAGLAAVELFDAVHAGRIRALWIIATNPVVSLPDADRAREALERCDLVVVSDCVVRTDTTALAHVLLPAAAWGEKDGTVTNSERRISRVRAAVSPPGEARADWEIAVDFGVRLKQLLHKKISLDYSSPEGIFNEHRETTRGRDLDITGLSYALLERDGPQQWPCPSGATAGRTRLYADGVFPTPSGRARFVATEYAPPAESTDVEYPICLTTGRLRDQWHSMTRTGLVARLFSHSPEPEVLLHKDSLQGFADGSLVRISSRRGSLVMKARASDDMRPGDAFVAMHWGARFMGGEGINALTPPAFDPYSKQPELKHAAVRIEPFPTRWRGIFSAVATPDLHRAAATWLPRFDYAALSLAEGPEILLRLELASAKDPDPKTLAALEDLFGAQPDTDLFASDRAVCACFKVPESTIRSAVAAGATLAKLQRELKCGTNCGSCIPELRRLVA